ncbi:MAG: 4Fe-4S ferredoxin [Desulfurococcaceae archaeon]
MYKLPRLIDTNAKSIILRDKEKLVVVSRCLETENPRVIEEFRSNDYVVLTACPEEEHVNMLGFKLAGILARCKFKEVAVLTVDGSMHCTQLHWMLEEVFKITKPEATRKHFVEYKGNVVEIPLNIVKKSRFLSKLRGVQGLNSVDQNKA